jgi:iron(III) transport system ATP-binding protein
MGELQLIEVSKSYDNVVAVENLSLTIHEGEFLTLLGPSGCGKTTTLRMIAGFTRPTTGSILLDGKAITSVDRKVYVPPEQRAMGMVFQSYAVWPHMTVFQNVAYPLKFKQVDRETVRERVERVLALVKLQGMAERYPHQLSGGQQQRVALARALIMEPEVLLLDEPLSNLDAKLREEMRFEITELQKRVRITIVYVTHDQVEAMSMSDRVVVMNQGRVLQVGTPREIYESPADHFVASFIGSANFLDAEVLGREGSTLVLQIAAARQVLRHTIDQAPADDRVTLVVRPESLTLCPPGHAPLTGTVLRRVYRGNHLDYLIQVGESQLRAEAASNVEFGEGAEVGLEMGNLVLLPRRS